MGHRSTFFRVSTPSNPATLRRYLLWMVLIGLLLRASGMLLLHSYRGKIDFDEGVHIGAALASGQGFSNPFGRPTGPTSWLGPVWPLVISGLFRLFGTYTRASIVAILLVNCAFSALTCIPIYFAVRSTFGERQARLSAWVWTLFPYTVYWGFRSTWNTALSALLLALLFAMTLALAQAGGLRNGSLHQWSIYGLLWGVAALTNTAELAFLPFAGIWICYRLYRQNKSFLRDAAVSAAVFFAVLTPWTIRNYQVFHKFIFVRGNFGVEFHLGNSPLANGDWQYFLHPEQNLPESRLYQQMGEAAYVKSKLDQALQFVHQQPARFAYLTFAHFFYFWTEPPHAERFAGIYELQVFLSLSISAAAFAGLVLALRQRRPGAVLYLFLFLSYPLVFYITVALARHRHPIEPQMLILIVFLTSQLSASRSRPPEASTQ